MIATYSLLVPNIHLLQRWLMLLLTKPSVIPIIVLLLSCLLLTPSGSNSWVIDSMWSDTRANISSVSSSPYFKLLFKMHISWVPIHLLDILAFYFFNLVLRYFNAHVWRLWQSTSLDPLCIVLLLIGFINLHSKFWHLFLSFTVSNIM